MQPPDGTLRKTRPVLLEALATSPCPPRRATILVDCEAALQAIERPASSGHCLLAARAQQAGRRGVDWRVVWVPSHGNVLLGPLLRHYRLLCADSLIRRRMIVPTCTAGCASWALNGLRGTTQLLVRPRLRPRWYAFRQRHPSFWKSTCVQIQAGPFSWTTMYRSSVRA